MYFPKMAFPANLDPSLKTVFQEALSKALKFTEIKRNFSCKNDNVQMILTYCLGIGSHCLMQMAAIVK